MAAETWTVVKTGAMVLHYMLTIASEDPDYTITSKPGDPRILIY